MNFSRKKAAISGYLISSYFAGMGGIIFNRLEITVFAFGIPLFIVFFLITVIVIPAFIVGLVSGYDASD